MQNPDFAGNLIHTATVLRRQAGTSEDDPFDEKVDEYGQPTRDEQDHHSVECRFSTPKGGRRMEERSHDVVQVRGRLFLDLDADLLETDVVTVTGPPDGRTIVERAIVDLVELYYDGVGPHHYEATLVTQREAT